MKSVRPKLTRYFAINFILVDILIVGAGGVVAYKLGRANLIAVAESHAKAAVNHLAIPIDQFYLQPWGLMYETYPFDDELAHRELTGVVKTFVSGFNVERVSIYDKNYRILFSTDSLREGQTEPTNSMLLSALAGNPVSRLVKEVTPEHIKTAAGKADHMQAFVPVSTRTKDGESFLAFEIVMDVSSTFRKVEQLRNVIILSTFVTGLALFFVVWLIATRADRAIKFENQERIALSAQIKRQNEDLELIVSQRTQQLRDTQAGLVQMEKMAATGQLAAGIAHEINNPVGIIKNRLELLLDDVKLERPIPDLESHFSMMHRQIERIGNIAGKLLSFARKSTTERVPVNIDQAINGLLLLVGKELEKRGIRLELDIPENLPQIQGNSTELEQVFLNLLINAMDATDRGGAISIIARQSDNRIQIRISDTGTGIAPENLSRLYDPFFTTKDVGVGTGLGLSITYRIVEDHGGTIMVASAPGHGTTFTLHFPILGQAA